MLLQPALLLIDFGHFQYNSVMLGLTLLAMNAFTAGHDRLGAIFFVLSLGFKQMALYYAPAIGAYLLAKCFYLGPIRGYVLLFRALPRSNLLLHRTRLFFSLAITTILTFAVLFLPFLNPASSILDPITRIFPFNRGLFEDKVANAWCASDVLVKWRGRLSRESLVRLSAAVTAAGFLPAVLGLLRSGYILRQSKNAAGEEEKNKVESSIPMLPLLPYALLTSSLSFFLFSFQVHEKTILVPLLPLTALLSGATVGSAVWEWGVLVNNVGVFR